MFATGSPKSRPAQPFVLLTAPRVSPTVRPMPLPYRLLPALTLALACNGPKTAATEATTDTSTSTGTDSASSSGAPVNSSSTTSDPTTSSTSSSASSSSTSTTSISTTTSGDPTHTCPDGTSTSFDEDPYDPEPCGYGDANAYHACSCRYRELCLVGLELFFPSGMSGYEAAGVCAAPCETTEDCPPAADGGSAVPECRAFGDAKFCVLDCSGGKTCGAGICSEAPEEICVGTYVT